MLDQVIYTCCFPHRLLKSNGHVERRDGFAVFSMSRELFSNKQITNFDLLDYHIAMPNGAKENAPVGLFNSYEYSKAAPDVYTLTYEVARPFCNIPRSNGKSHRSGTFIKQCLVGNIEGYPYEWIGASEWDAHQKPENDYYLDDDPDASPEFLPQVSSAPTNGYINTSVIKEFVKDGRADAVKAGIWFLLQEFKKNEGDRKVLLIKDVPENVELWIAAIECGFSEALARKITFTTNRSKLGTQTDFSLFYYTDDNGRFNSMMNRGISQTRHPYCMIVGFHPKDAYCAAVRQMPTSNFVIIDGTSKTVAFQTDETIHMPYYSAVVEFDTDIQDFCNVVLPSLPINDLAGNLPELYDAYKYLLDSNHNSDKWSYSEAVHHLDTLLQFGTPINSALNNYLVSECLSAYQRFIDEDALKEYPFLKHVWNIAKPMGKEKEVTACISDAIRDKLNHLADPDNGISATWDSLNKSNIVDILQPCFKDLFSDSELPGYAKQFTNSGPASVETTLEMYLSMLSAEGIGLDSISETKERYSFVCYAIVGLRNDRERLLRVLKELSADPKLFHSISLSVAKYIEKYEPSESADWWDTTMNVSGGSAAELCESLCGSKSANIDIVEKLLANSVERSGRLTSDLEMAFNDAADKLGKNSDTGRWIYTAWIKVSQPNDYVSIIQSIKKSGLNSQAEKDLFNLIDSGIPYDAGRSIKPEVYHEVKLWAEALNVVSRSVSLSEFKKNFENTRKVEEAVKLAHSFAGNNFSIDKNFLESNSFAEITAVSAGFSNDELHIALLCLFQSVADSSLDHYVNEYVTKLLDATKGRDLVPQLLSLCKAAAENYIVPGRSDSFVSGIQKRLETALANQLIEYYKPNLAEQVSKYNEYDKDTRNKLVHMIEDAGKKYKPKGVGGLINKLFGKR